MSGSREMNQLVRKLRKQGYLIERSQSGHWKVRSPKGGVTVHLPCSPRNSSLRSTYHTLRLIGYKD